MPKIKQNHLNDKEVVPFIETQKCEVCFISTDKTHQNEPYMQLLQCTKCYRKCHRICYNSTVTTINFECDPCKDRAKNKNCIFCHNSGLLKRVKEGHYAHLICSIINHDVVVTDYRTLKLKVFRQPRECDKEDKCDICHGTSEYGFGCFKDKCNKKVHLYCLIEANGEDQKFNLKVNHRFTFFTQSLIINYLKHQDKTFKGLKQLVDQQIEPGVYSCATHCQQFINSCICEQGPDLKEENIEWVSCDRCKYWYHAVCITESQKIKQDSLFVCQLCRQYKDAKMNNTLDTLTQFPLLHLYDCIELQIRVQLKLTVPECLMDDQVFTGVIDTSNPISNVENMLAKNLRYLLKVEEQDEIELFIKELKITDKVQLLANIPKPKKKKHQYKLDQLLKSLQLLVDSSASYKSRFGGFLTLLSKWHRNDTASGLQKQIIELTKELKKTNIDPVQAYVQSVSRMNTYAADVDHHHKFPLLFKFLAERKDPANSIKALKLFKQLYAVSQVQEHRRISRQYMQTLKQTYKSLKGQYDQLLSKLFWNVSCSTLISSEAEQYQITKKTAESQLTTFSRMTTQQFQIIKQHELQMCLSHSQIFNEWNSHYMSAKACQGKLNRLLTTFTRQNYRRVNLGRTLLKKLRVTVSDQAKYQKYIALCNIIEAFYKALIVFKDMQPQQQLDYNEMLTFIQYQYPIVAKQESFQWQVQLITLVEQLSEGVWPITPLVQQSFKVVIIDYIKIYCEDVDQLEVSKLRNLIKLLKLFQVDNCLEYQKALVAYQEWQTNFIEQINDLNFCKLLDEMKPTKKLLETAEEAIRKANEIGCDVTQEINKLRRIELWCRITLKNYEELQKCKQKIKLQSLKQIYMVLNKSKYPKNKTHAKLTQLYSTTMALVNRAQLFPIKKSKKEFETYEEMAIVENKMTVADAKILIVELKDSVIDFEFKIDDILEELNRFEEKQKSAAELISKRGGLDELLKLHKYFLAETPLKYPRFYELREAIKRQRCHNIPKCRRQLQMLLNWGGLEAMELANRTQSTRNVYKKLQALQDAARFQYMLEYVELDKIREMSKCLLEEDTHQKDIIMEWENIILKGRKKYENMTRSCYRLQEAEQLLNATRRVPVKNQEMEIDFARRKMIFQRNNDTVLRLYGELVKGVNVLNQEQLASILTLTSIFNSNKFVSRQLETLKLQRQKYVQLLHWEQNKDNYLQYLRECHELNPCFYTKELQEKRLRLFVSCLPSLQLKSTRQLVKMEVLCLLQSYNEAALLDTINTIVKFVEISEQKQQANPAQSQDDQEVSEDENQQQQHQSQSQEEDQQEQIGSQSQQESPAKRGRIIHQDLEMININKSENTRKQHKPDTIQIDDD